MKFLENNSSVSTVDKGVRNSWKWHWLDDVCEKGKSFGSWCKKLDVPGKCYCTVCAKIIVYGSAGKKALKFHANQSDHVSRALSVESCSKLDSGSNSDFKASKSLQDSSSEVKALIGLFISEHCLPFNLGPELLNLCKKASKEKLGLESATLSATSMTYATTHGVAEDVKKTLVHDMRDQFISLNLDEATMDSGDKVLNILAQYYQPDLGRCVIDLIGCKEINHAPAEKVIQVVDERQLRWSQIISILMDNCSVMRGQKEGVEPKARQRNKFLLDIDGDAVHKINNAAQKLFCSIEKFYSMQTIASEIYADIENSPKQRLFFKEIQKLLGLNRKMVLRPISNRFLQFKAVSERINELWDPLKLYYAASLEASEKDKVQKLISDITAKYELSSNSTSLLTDVIMKLSKQKQSEAGKRRKDKIVNALFDQEMKTLMCFRLYIGILGKFESFVKCFQSKKPLAHKLHFEIFHVVKTFFSCFVKPDLITSFDPSKLKEVDFKKPENQVKDRHLCVGEMAYSTLMMVMKDKEKFTWTKQFFAALRDGYVEAASMLLKLPIHHPILSKLSYIDPSFQRSLSTTPALLSLGESLGNVIPAEELGKLDGELRKYSCDEEVTMIDCDSDDSDFRLDRDYWSKVFNMKSSTGFRYPILSKLVKALLSIFSGPLIEGTFNILNDIIEEDRTKLTNHNYEALLMVKSYLNARELKAVSMDIPKSMVREVTASYSNYTNHMNKKVADKKSEKGLSLTTKNVSEASSSPAPEPAISVPEQEVGLNAACESSAEMNSVDRILCQAQKSGVKRKAQSSLMSFFSKKPCN